MTGSPRGLRNHFQKLAQGKIGEQRSVTRSVAAALRISGVLGIFNKGPPLRTLHHSAGESLRTKLLQSECNVNCYHPNSRVEAQTDAPQGSGHWGSRLDQLSPQEVVTRLERVSEGPGSEVHQGASSTCRKFACTNPLEPSLEVPLRGSASQLLRRRV